ncbi:MAG: hypothetical protein HPY79_09640 [Bacteroidales bacterium]|nr:hypothetical protein [Bacteroidales bacterium]
MIDFFAIMGYAASIIIAISMTMSSIVKFRIINFIGAATFSIYGFLIGAIPVGVLNAFIAIVDIYFLYGIFSKKEIFETLEVRPDNRYLVRFLEFYNNDLQKYFPEFTYKPEMNTISYLILRNMSVAGVFLAHKTKDDTLCVGLDYVIPEYRDFKNGKYIYSRLVNRFKGQGIKKVTSPAWSKEYVKYLQKLGFKKVNENNLEINIS